MPLIIDQTVEIQAPPELVWQVLTDLPRYGEWNPFCLVCESTLQPGDPIRMQVNLTGKPQAVEEVMAVFIPGRRFAYRMKPMPAGALSSLRSHDLEPSGPAQTRYHSHFELRGWLRPLVLALYGRTLEAGFAAMTDAVRTRAETLWRQQRKSA